MLSDFSVYKKLTKIAIYYTLISYLINNKKSMNQKGNVNLLVVALVGIIVILLGTVIYLLASKNSDPIVYNPIINEPVATDEPITKDEPITSTPTQDEIVDWKTYKNDKYGFELKFPKSWEGFKTKNRELNWGIYGKSDSIDFGFKKQESLFNTSFLTIEQWDKIKLDEGPKPIYINRNNEFVFVYGIAQDAVDQDIASKMKDASGIISTFKFTETTALDNSQSSAKLFCQSLVGPNLKLGTFDYYSNNNDEKFADCGIGNDQGGVHVVAKYINGVWTKIWTGNGDISKEDIIKYNIPNEIKAAN
jgi:hypothetical protein